MSTKISYKRNRKEKFLISWDEGVRYALNALAEQRMKDDGKRVTISSLILEAIEETHGIDVKFKNK